MTLYELTQAMQNFDFDIDEETGEILNADELDQLELDRTEKLKSCVFYYKNMKAEAEALKAEKQVLAKRQQIAERKAERMKEYLDFNLQGEKFEPDDDVRVRITYRKSKVVECPDLSAVDSEFLRFKDPELDKTKVKAAFKDGKEVKGCSLVVKENIQIK